MCRHLTLPAAPRVTNSFRSGIVIRIGDSYDTSCDVSRELRAVPVHDRHARARAAPGDRADALLSTADPACRKNPAP